MSISSQQSPPWATDDWDAVVEREVARQGAIEAAFARAEACASEGAFRRALEWLDRASELSGGLSEAYRAQRAHLAAELDTSEH
jgi:hypothetical protein